jgi:hypothetical protein
LNLAFESSVADLLHRLFILIEGSESLVEYKGSGPEDQDASQIGLGQVGTYIISTFLANIITGIFSSAIGL